MKKSFTAKLAIYKYDLKTKGLYWSIIHRLYKIPYVEKFLKPFVTFYKPSYVRVDTNKIYIDNSDQVVSQALLMYKTWEPFQTEVFLKQIKKGDVIVDIGAHIGYYTLYAAKQTEHNGRVYAFEPDSKNFHLLQKNIRENGYANVSLQNSAISNKNTTQLLYTDTVNSGDHRLYDSGEKRGAIPVNTVTLDTFFQKETATIDLIKLDIQGNECNALLGAQNILQHSKKLKIITEFYPKGLSLAGGSSEAYLKLLTTYGFIFYEISENEKRVKKITADKLLQQYKNDSEQFTNLLCLRNLP